MFRAFAMYMAPCGSRMGDRNRENPREFTRGEGCGAHGPSGGRRRFGWDGPGRGFGPRGGFGGGRERLFDPGMMRLVILQQLAKEPAYGYQLIKLLEEKLAGGYRPSAGVIYPTLTMLEEQGLTASTVNESGKKVYAVTDEGRALLEENKQRLQEIDAVVEEAGSGFKRGRSPEVMGAFLELRQAVIAKLRREGVTEEQVKRVAEAIRAAAKRIDEI